jgi:hypothetical protein
VTHAAKKRTVPATAFDEAAHIGYMMSNVMYNLAQRARCRGHAAVSR